MKSGCVIGCWLDTENKSEATVASFRCLNCTSFAIARHASISPLHPRFPTIEEGHVNERV